MAKAKKINWDHVKWTPFEQAEIPPDRPKVDMPDSIWVNSKYQVELRRILHPELGRMIHLSFKTRDRQPYHDWRDMQRIKNELVGPEYEAVELFPAESRLMDTSNQYHLWCFLDTKLPFGYTGRVVTEAPWGKSKQRPWPADSKPKDLMSAEEVNRKTQEYLDRGK